MYSKSAELFSTRTHFMLDRNICSTYIHDMKRISMFLSESQIAKLKKLSKRTGIKASELVRRFIDEGLKKA
jgi:ribbon-helix-helix protein